jgi:hypothetical protein
VAFEIDVSERRKFIIADFFIGLGFSWVLGEVGFDITVRVIIRSWNWEKG